MVYITIPTNIDAGKREKKKGHKICSVHCLEAKNFFKMGKIIKKKGVCFITLNSTSTARSDTSIGRFQPELDGSSPVPTQSLASEGTKSSISSRIRKQTLSLAISHESVEKSGADLIKAANKQQWKPNWSLHPQKTNSNKKTRRKKTTTKKKKRVLIPWRRWEFAGLKSARVSIIHAHGREEAMEIQEKKGRIFVRLDEFWGKTPRKYECSLAYAGSPWSGFFSIGIESSKQRMSRWANLASDTWVA